MNFWESGIYLEERSEFCLHILWETSTDKFICWWVQPVVPSKHNYLRLFITWAGPKPLHFLKFSFYPNFTDFYHFSKPTATTNSANKPTGYVLHFCFDKKQILSHRKTALWKCVEVWLSAEFFIGLKNMKVTPRVRKQLLLKASRLRFLFKNQLNQHLKPGRTAWFLG